MTSQIDIRYIFNEMQTCNTNEISHYITTLTNEILNSNIKIYQITELIDIILAHCKKSNISQIIFLFKNLIDELNTSNENNSRQSDLEGHEVINAIYEHLQETLQSRSTFVRKNTLAMLQIIFLNLEPDKEFLLKVCERLFDKEKEVVKQALFVLSSYQEVKVNKKDCIYDIYKDLLRHDPNADVRRTVLKYILINENTVNCIVEKITDKDFGVRNYFYKNVVGKIQMKKLKKEKLEFLIDKCFSERVFEYKEKLVEKIIEEFNLKSDLHEFLYNYKIKELEGFLDMVFKKINFECNDLPKDYTDAKLFFMFYDYVERNEGRDSINLPDLETFLKFLAEKTQKLNQSDAEYVSELIKLLKFYDFFSIEDIIKLKTLVNSLLSIKLSEDVIESIVKLIKKNLDDEETISKMISNEDRNYLKYILKHFVKLSKKQLDAIDDLMTKDTADLTYETIYFYYCYKPDKELLKMLYRSNNLNIMTDLYLLDKEKEFKNNKEVLNLRKNENNFDEKNIQKNYNEKDKEDNYDEKNKEDNFDEKNNEIFNRDKENKELMERIDFLVYEGMKNMDEEICIPLMKLLMCGHYKKIDFLVFIMECYYKESENMINQYTTMFLHEYFKKDASLLIENFSLLLQKIQNKKIFVSQALFWAKNSKTINASQKLFFNICVEAMKSKNNKTLIMEFIGVLNQIEIDEKWDKIMTKKILFLASMLIKKIENKNVMNNIVGKLMTIDDGYPLEKSNIEEVNFLII
ncbi:chromosome condensation complex Condensin [Gurleya vavrai]